MDINGSTALTGLVAAEPAPSPSPAMHNAAFRELGMNWCYLPLRVRQGELEAAIEGMRALSFRGANVTIPHKLEAASLADRLEGDALLLEAVNTLVFAPDGVVGHNTDARGLQRSLEEAGAGRLDSLFLIGAGGAARAAALAAARLGARELYVFNRGRERAERLREAVKRAGLFDEIYLQEYNEDGAQALAVCTCVINSTPLAQAEPEGLPLDYRLFREGQLVVDLNYLHRSSFFLRSAGQRGARTANGRSMLLYQAAESFRLWTGREAPLEAMRTALEEFLG
jgi:shikimate dehydrogenase